ncbi:hypothetical protein DL771_006605 [Monosporascus sp. 5C6A]|nr:hypothetical protein DL771_006605 [Monosporascus sp. 5C6A]
MCAVKKLVGVCLIGLAVASPIVVPSAAVPRETEDGVTEWPHFNPVDITPPIKPKPTSQPRAARSLFNQCGSPPLQPCWGLEDEIRRRLDEANPLARKVTDDPKKPFVRPGPLVPHIVPPEVPHPPAGHHEDENEDGSSPKTPGVKRGVAGAEAEPLVVGLRDFEDHNGPVPPGPVTTMTGVAVTRVTVTTTTTVPTLTIVSTKKSAAPVPTDPVTVSAQVTVTILTRVTVVTTVPTTISKWVPVIPVTTSTRVPVVTSTGVNVTTWTVVPTTIRTTVLTTISKWVPTTFSTWFPTTSSTVPTLAGDPLEWPGTYTKPRPKTTLLEAPRPSYKDKSSHAPGLVGNSTAKFPGTYTNSFSSRPKTTPLESPRPTLEPESSHTPTTATKSTRPDQRVDSVPLWPLPPLQARGLEPEELPSRPLGVPTELFPMKTVASDVTVTVTVTATVTDRS